MQNISSNSNNKPIVNTLNIPPVMSQSNIASQLTEVSSSGTEGVLPINNIEGSANISGNADQLHETNHTAQINNITDLLFKIDPSINKGMVTKALNAGNHGSSAQQELNHRLESALVVLTLFDNIPQSVLLDAVKSVQKIDKIDLNNDEHVSDMLNTVQKKLDKQLNSFLSSMEGDVLNDLATRYQERYVDPAIKQQLNKYFSDDEINSHPIDEFLLTSENVRLENSINNSIKEYNKVGNKHYGDKYQHLNNIFRHIEHKLTIIRPLKVGMTLNESTKPKAPLQQTSDMVDGKPDITRPNSSGNISNSYNTTTNNYFNPSLSESIKHISHQDDETNKPQEQEFRSSNKSTDIQLFDNAELLLKKVIKLPRVLSDTFVEAPSPDYDLPDIKILDGQPRDAENVEPNHVDHQLASFTAREEWEVQQVKNRFDLASEVAQKNEKASKNASDILPKMASHYGSYLIDKKIPAGVKLTNNRELVQNKLTKSIERESPFAIKNTSIYRTTYINNDKRVVLSTEGLMTRNLNEKLVYEDKPQGG